MIDFNTYDGNYVILRSDRLILDSKEESIFLLGKKDITLSAVNQVHINVGPKESKDPDKNYFIINAPKIQLGLASNGTNEHVAKAESTISFINDLLLTINTFANSVSSATALGVGVSKIPEISIAARVLSGKLNMIKTKYGLENSPIKSKITSTI
jgi:hypothetical protein